MAGSPIKRERRARWLALKADPAFAEDCIARIACGDSVRALAAENDIPVTTFWRWLMQEYGAEVAAARKAVAALLADQILDAADRVEAGELNPKAAQAAASIRQWLASRYDRDTFGDKSRVDLNVSSVQQMHLEALRQIAQEDTTLDGGYTTLNDEESEGDRQDSEDDHPLL